MEETKGNFVFYSKSIQNLHEIINQRRNTNLNFQYLNLKKKVNEDRMD